MSKRLDVILRHPLTRAVIGLGPLLLWEALFFLVPMGILFVYSFWRMRDFRLNTAFTLYNYAEIIQNPLLWRAFVLSLKIAVAVTLVCAVIGYPMAYFIAKRAGPWKTLCLVGVVIPFWTSFILRAYAWKLLLGEHGIINSGLLRLGLIDAPLSGLLYSPIATSIGLVYGFLPFMIMPLYTSIEKVQDSWLQAAADLGAPPWRTFWEVTFPVCGPGLVVGAVFTFIFAVGEYVIAALLGGGKSLMVAQAIVLEFETEQNWPGGAALAIALLVIILAMLGLLLRWVRMEDVL